MVQTSALLWPNQRDYKGAVDLWTKAAERKHWKAMLNLANAYVQGRGWIVIPNMRCRSPNRR